MKIAVVLHTHAAEKQLWLSHFYFVRTCRAGSAEYCLTQHTALLRDCCRSVQWYGEAPEVIDHTGSHIGCTLHKADCSKFHGVVSRFAEATSSLPNGVPCKQGALIAVRLATLAGILSASWLIVIKFHPVRLCQLHVTEP